MSAGTRLPGVRELSARFQASAATISNALAELTARGLVRAEPGRGTFVIGRGHSSRPDYAWQSQALGAVRVDADRASRLGAHGQPEQLPLSWGYLADELQPTEHLRRIGARVARSARGWDLTPPSGSAELRRLIAAEYRAQPEDVQIVPGGQQALVFALRTLAEPGETVVMESPTYPGAILAAQSAGLRIAAVPADAEGIRTDLLADELERTRARVVYLQPSFANPTGAVMSDLRRREVVALAVARGAFIVEDDWARHLGLERPAPAPLFTADADGHVVSITTLAKPISPGLRVGAIIARGPAGARLRASRIADDLGVSPLMQEVALEFLSSSEWARHRKRLRIALGDRRDALLAAVAGSDVLQVPALPQGGLHLWVRLPDDADARTVSRAAQTEGVLVGDGSHYFVDEPPSPYLRLSFGAASPPQMAEGVRRLESVVH
ncbi:PLP-dependent aminotransferase family protein [Microbacterium gorillae]|uniref:aminotransferase-like domain-containing protein n=1 Tax=Microbacterium gorillae TaxID=1231063 RepID=UPI003D96F696